jgi:GntR family transcriptional repressor for pyruvate dehydrogenase complex
MRSGLSASRTAMELIRERIASHEFPPLSRLPRETELAASLGVSRSALREAIRALELVGVLRSRHGAGTFVTALEPRDLMRGLTFSRSLLTTGSAAELAEFRRVTEPAACALACRRATEGQKAGIRKIFEEMERVTDPQRYTLLDSQLHHAILEASGNSVLTAVTSALTHGPAWHTMWHTVMRDAVMERTRREHEALVTAIETGDGELAVATAHAHIAETQRRIAGAALTGTSPSGRGAASPTPPGPEAPTPAKET